MHSGELDMGLTNYKLGDLIEQSDKRNTYNKYTVDRVKGISTGKKFIETKANMDGVNLSSYKIVSPHDFAYVADTSRRGDKIALAFNRSTDYFLISSIYTVFRVSRDDLLNSDYLFMYFNRPEFDRYSRFNSWGSARETFDWDAMCDIEIDLPPLVVQQKYLNVYNSMLANQQSYERGLEDLNRSFEVIVDTYKHSAPRRTVGSLLREVDNRNLDTKITDVQGINIDKKFMPSVANTIGVDLSKYKVVNKGQFAFSGMQTGRDQCIRLALHDADKPIIISPAYSVFENKTKDVLSEYIMLWFTRKEVDRLGWFMSDASIRTNLDMDRFNEITIPVPDTNTQMSIVEIYTSYITRQRINEQLKNQIKDICPILIKGSIEEGRKEA